MSKVFLKSVLVSLMITVLLMNFMTISPTKVLADSNNTDVANFVTSLYSDCLGRSPDSTGLNDWCSKLSNHVISGKEAAYGFFFSPEFISKANSLSDDDLIDAYYRVFLNRGADPNGKTYWSEKISNTTNDVSILFTGFADSTEFAQKCASYGIEAGVHIDVPTTTRGTDAAPANSPSSGQSWADVATIYTVPPEYSETGDNSPLYRQRVVQILNENNPYEPGTRQWAVTEADKVTRALQTAYGRGSATAVNSGSYWTIDITGIDYDTLYRDGWS